MLLKPDGKGGWTDFLKIPQADTLTTGIRGFDKTGNVAYLTDSRDRDTGALATLDLKTGEEKIIAEDPQADAGGIMAPADRKHDPSRVVHLRADALAVFRPGGCKPISSICKPWPMAR